MHLRYSLPRVRGRGAGLGNELIPWARSYIAAQIIGAVSLPPAFGLNSRKYWMHFGTPRYDWILHQALQRILPLIEFKESDYIQAGGGDFVQAFTRFAESKGLHKKSAFVITTEGMWGGYNHLSAAKDFMVSTLYQSRFAPGNLIKISKKLNPKKILVALHVRLGDFSTTLSEVEDYRGKFNCSLPFNWYINIAKSIYSKLGDDVQFLVVSDGSREQLKPLLDNFPAITTIDIPDSDCSDILALSKADLLVCSISSYSSLAAFISEGPYIWFEPNLQRHQEGFYSIWGHMSNQNDQARLINRAIKFQQIGNKTVHRGRPVGIDGNVPDELIDQLIIRKIDKNYYGDLVLHGVVPISSF